MPFTRPWKDKYEENDLIYGVAATRGRYVTSVDQFNQAGLLRSQGIPGYVIDQYAAIFTERDKMPKLPTFQKDFSAALLEHPKYSSIFNNTSSVSGVGDKIEFRLSNSDARRKCKAGLHWASQSPLGISVHFLLDKINLSQVVHKDSDYDLDEEWRSVTSAELRWVYRNRHNPNVQRTIQFWLDGRPISPPWTAVFRAESGITYDPVKLWSEYRPTGKELSIRGRLARFFRL